MKERHSNLHTHTNFSDGKHSLAEMIDQAVSLNFVSIGISDHSPTPFDSGCCLPDHDAYVRAVREAKEDYADRIEVYLGIEKDYYTKLDPADYDYVIGSVHYFPYGDEVIPVDQTAAHQKRFFDLVGGDRMEFVKRYYDTLVRHAQTRAFQIQGHFDLPKKFGYFDFESEALCRLEEQAMDEVLANVPFWEVNVGGIARGLRTEPYPDKKLLGHLLQHNAKLLLGSDAHRREHLSFQFDQTLALLAEIGFSSVWQLRGGEMKEIPIAEFFEKGE